jgi:hypothetical protein
MKKVFILLAAAVLISSCDSEAPGDTLFAPTPNITETASPTPSPTEKEPTMSGHGDPPEFNSEEEFLEYMLSKRNVILDEGEEIDPRSLFALTHYYRLNNLPPETNIYYITPGNGVSIVYHMYVEGFRERIMIKYSSHFSFDIEVDGLWRHRPFPEESHIIELEGIKYYIRKVTGLGETILLWSAEWYNEDGYYMSAELPYRFTVEEVLGLVSDIERVEIR